MNIVIANVLGINPQTGGIERVSSKLAVEFERLGHTVYFVAMRYGTSSYEPVVEQILLPDKFVADSEENITGLTSFIVEKRIDILINQAGDIAVFSNLCIAVKSKTNIKLISVIHFAPAYAVDSYHADLSLLKYRLWVGRQIFFYLKKVFTFRLKRLVKKSSYLNNLLYRESDAVILLSEYFKPAFQKMTGLVDISKLKAIGNPLSFQVSEEAYSKEKQILWVGRMDFYQKRPERLIQIWSYLEDKHPDWNVLFLGDGPSKPKAEKFVQRLGLKNVRFEGFTDPEDAYRKSSILCMTSTFEGFGMVLTEAMQFETVPLAFDSFESLQDIIIDGVTGYKIKPFDLKQYALCLESLMTDENKRRHMSLNARKHVTEKFDPRHITKQWLSLFE